MSRRPCPILLVVVSLVLGWCLTLPAEAATVDAYWKFDLEPPPGNNYPVIPDAATDPDIFTNPPWGDHYLNWWAGGGGSTNYTAGPAVPESMLRSETSLHSFDSHTTGGGQGVLFYDLLGGLPDVTNLTGSKTVEGFFRTHGDQSGAGNMEVLHHAQTNQTWIVRLNEGGGGRMRFAVRGADNSYHWAELTDRNYADGQWHYFQAEYDQQAGPDQLRLNVTSRNGVTSTASVDTAAAWTPGTDNHNLFFGRSTINAGNRFRGLIGEVRISSGLLGPGESLGLAPPPEPNTVAHWRFEDNVLPGSHNAGTHDPAIADSGPRNNPLWYWNGGWGNYQSSPDVAPQSMFKPGFGGGSKSFDPGAMGTAGNGVLFFERGTYGDQFNFSDSFTLEGMFKTDGDKSGAGRMEVLFQSQAAYNYLVNLNEGTPGEVRFAMAGTPMIRLTDRNYADGEWHYFAAKYIQRDGPDALSLTVTNEDGSRSTVHTLTAAGFAPATSTSNMFIGRQWHVPPRATFQGLIDELRISDAALSADQLMTPSQTVAHWKFEDDVAPGSHNSPGNDAITDSSGNNNPLWYWNGGWGDYQRSADVPSGAIAGRATFGNRWSFDPGSMPAGGNGTLFFEVGQFGNDLSFVDDFTLEGYFKTSESSGLMEIIQEGAGQQTYLVRMNEGGPGTLRFAMRGQDNSYHWVDLDDPADAENFADDQWHYFAARYDRRDGADLLDLLVAGEDGGLLTGSVLTAGTWEPGFTSANMFIGRTWHLGGSYNTFRGLIDEIRISDGFLADGQLMFIPEPSTLLLAGLGLLGLLLFARRRRRIA